MLEERPDHVNKILISLRYWDKKQMLIFMDHFINNNCDKIKLFLTEKEIKDSFEFIDELELKKILISLLQKIKKNDNVKLMLFN